MSTKYYAIRSAQGVVRPLDFDADPGLEAGTRIRVWGSSGSSAVDRMRVTSMQRLAPRPETETVTAALKSGTKYPAKRLAFVIIDIGAGTNLTAETR